MIGGQLEKDAEAPAKTRPDSDTLTQSETVILYGLSAGRCAKCKRPVVKESKKTGKAYNMGKRGHMVGRSDEGPRGDPTVPKRERGNLKNHLLLCGSCHDEVDLDSETWPLERLLELRAEHIAWVAQLDDEEPIDHNRLIYAKAIDAGCELIWLDAWAQWTEQKLDPPVAWSHRQVEAAGEFSTRMNTTDWPGSLPDLEVALLRLAHLVNESAHTFSDRAEPVGSNMLRVIRAYKRGVNPNYHRDREEFIDWLEYYEGLLFEATMAANWVRSAWRAADNPDFLPGEHLYLVTGPHMDFRYRNHVLEYSEQQKIELRQAGPDGVRGIESLTIPHRPQDDLDRLVREIIEEVTGEEPAFDFVEGVAQRIRALDGPIDSGVLLRGLPGRMLSGGNMKRVTHALFEHEVLKRNPAGRGFILGDVPDLQGP